MTHDPCFSLLSCLQYPSYARMPFAAGSQQQMQNYYHLTREYEAAVRGTSGLRSWHVTDAYGQNMAYGQPYVMAQQPHPPPPQQQPQAQPSHASQQQQPQPQQQQGPGPGPQRHPLPSPSPVNSGMVIQVSHDPVANKAGVAPPSTMVPNPAAVPFKPRPKKMALLQDPETMEVVDLVKSAAGSDATQSSASSTSLRSTPSADSVKAEAAASADPAVPEPAKTLPNVSLLSTISNTS